MDDAGGIIVIARAGSGLVGVVVTSLFSRGSDVACYLRVGVSSLGLGNGGGGPGGCCLPGWGFPAGSPLCGSYPRAVLHTSHHSYDGSRVVVVLALAAAVAVAEVAGTVVSPAVLVGKGRW